MKKIFGLITTCIIMFSCGGTNTARVDEIEEAEKDSILTDTLAVYMQKLDSLNNSGELRHVKVYKLGNIKTIEFSVMSVESKSDTIEFINMRKDCGGDYYYDWEDASLLAEEVKYFVSAIDTISANLDRTVQNEERYIYITKDDIRLFSSNETPGSGRWSTSLSVDYRKSNSHIYIGKDDLGSLKSMLLTGEQKISEIRKR